MEGKLFLPPGLTSVNCPTPIYPRMFTVINNCIDYCHQQVPRILQKKHKLICWTLSAFTDGVSPLWPCHSLWLQMGPLLQGSWHTHRPQHSSQLLFHQVPPNQVLFAGTANPFAFVFKAKAGMFNGGRQGWVGWECCGGCKWRQLYLNNN